MPKASDQDLLRLGFIGRSDTRLNWHASACSHQWKSLATGRRELPGATGGPWVCTTCGEHLSAKERRK